MSIGPFLIWFLAIMNTASVIDTWIMTLSPAWPAADIKKHHRYSAIEGAVPAWCWAMIITGQA